MHVRPRQIYSRAGVTHARDSFAALDELTRLHSDRAQVAVETVVIAATQTMLDHDVVAVVRMRRHAIRVNHFASGDRAHFVERLAALVALQRTDIDPLVKAGVDQAGARLHRVAHETVLRALPGG